MNYPVITVVWGDHWIYYGEQSKEGMEANCRPFYRVTSGHLVSDKNGVLGLCSTPEMIDGEMKYTETNYLIKSLIKFRSDQPEKGLKKFRERWAREEVLVADGK